MIGRITSSTDFRALAGRLGWIPSASISPRNRRIALNRTKCRECFRCSCGQIPAQMHRETKELPIYALVLAKKDNQLGPRLTESKEGGCAQFDLSKPQPSPESGKPPPLGCGGMMMGPDRVAAASVPIADLTPVLSRILERSVVDKTGLTGKFDINLQWTPDPGQAMQFAPDGPRPPVSDATGPSIFTALQEQLGLKLESQRGPVEIFVIDRAEKPSQN